MTESKLQSDCFIWAWNERPETRNLLCYNLNNSRNRVDGARNKSLGLISGRSDMVLYWRGRAVMLEFKQPKGGYQSKAQQNWQKIVERHGFEYHLVRSMDQFQKIIDEVIR